MWIIDSNRMIWLYQDDIWYYEWECTEWNEMDLIIPIVDIDKIVYSSWFYAKPDTPNVFETTT